MVNKQRIGRVTEKGMGPFGNEAEFCTILYIPELKKAEYCYF